MAKRRRQGEGSIFHRKSDGRWLAVADHGYVPGPGGMRRRVRKTSTFRTEQEAVRGLRKMLRDVEKGVLPSSATVEQWMTHWLDDIAAEHVKPKTLVGYRQLTNNHIIPAIGRKKLSRLTPDDVLEMHAALKAKEARGGGTLSEATIRQVHAVLQKSLTIALRQGRVERNVAQLAPPKKPTRRPHPILTLDQANRVIRTAKDDPRLRARLICALALGLRQGEALGLRWERVTIDGRVGMLTVSETVQQIHGQGLVTGSTKNDTVRHVPMPALAASAMKTWREKSGGTGYVFHGHRGPQHPEGPKRDWQAWTDALEAAGVPHVPLHGARGSAGTLLQSLGVPDRVIADILGHLEVQTTQAHYLRSDDMQRMAAMELVGAALDPDSGAVVPVASADEPAREVKVRLPGSLLDQIDELASDADVSRSAWISEALTRLLNTRA